MLYFAGIDIGSTAIKIVVIDENEIIKGYKVSGSGSMFYKYAKESFELLLKDIGISSQDVAYITSTGYGRKLFKEAGYEIRSTEFFDRGNYSGTEIRRRILSGERWTNLVPEGTKEVIDRIGGVARIRMLSCT